MIIQTLNLLYRSLREAKQHYEVWWYLSDANKDQDINNILCNQKYAPFFQNVVNSNFKSFIFELHSVFEKGKSKTNIYKLIDDLAEEYLENSDKLNRLVKLNTETIRGVLILRNNSTGHIPTKMSHKEAYKLADLAPEGIEKLINDFYQALSQIKLSISGFCPHSHSGNKIIRLLCSDLNRKIQTH